MATKFEANQEETEAVVELYEGVTRVKYTQVLTAPEDRALDVVRRAPNGKIFENK
jgi:hypothetical protein